MPPLQRSQSHRVIRIGTDIPRLDNRNAARSFLNFTLCRNALPTRPADVSTQQQHSDVTDARKPEVKEPVLNGKVLTSEQNGALHSAAADVITSAIGSGSGSASQSPLESPFNSPVLLRRSNHLSNVTGPAEATRSLTQSPVVARRAVASLPVCMTPLPTFESVMKSSPHTMTAPITDAHKPARKRASTPVFGLAPEVSDATGSGVEHGGAGEARVSLKSGVGKPVGRSQSVKLLASKFESNHVGPAPMAAFAQTQSSHNLANKQQVPGSAAGSDVTASKVTRASSLRIMSRNDDDVSDAHESAISKKLSHTSAFNRHLPTANGHTAQPQVIPRSPSHDSILRRAQPAPSDVTPVAAAPVSSDSDVSEHRPVLSVFMPKSDSQHTWRPSSKVIKSASFSNVTSLARFCPTTVSTATDTSTTDAAATSPLSAGRTRRRDRNSYPERSLHREAIERSQEQHLRQVRARSPAPAASTTDDVTPNAALSTSLTDLTNLAPFESNRLQVKQHNKNLLSPRSSSTEDLMTSSTEHLVTPETAHRFDDVREEEKLLEMVRV